MSFKMLICSWFFANITTYLYLVYVKNCVLSHTNGRFLPTIVCGIDETKVKTRWIDKSVRYTPANTHTHTCTQR